MMTDRNDLVKRSLAMRCEEAGKNGAARRKARFMAAIANLETDLAERARVESIAVDAGIVDQADHVPHIGEDEKPETGLLQLRSAAGGESPEEEPTLSRFWHFQDGGPVTFVCAQLPDDQIRPFGDPANPNYTELQAFADIDALIELHGHIRAENPAATLHFKTPADVEPDELTGHLILLGGVVWNEITERLSETAKLPVRQVANQELDSGEIFVAEVAGEQRQFWPQWMDEDKTMLTEDVALLARVPNPLNASRTLTICNGIHSRGVYGAVRSLTDAQLRDGNERYISTNFGDAASFAILMSVKITKNKAMTPDFNSPEVVLHQWAREAA